MQTPGDIRSEAGSGNAMVESIGAAIAAAISLILLVCGATLAGLLGLGPIGAFWFGVLVKIAVLALVAWTAFVLLYFAHFSTLSRFL